MEGFFSFELISLIHLSNAALGKMLADSKMRVLNLFFFLIFGCVGSLLLRAAFL